MSIRKFSTYEIHGCKTFYTTQSIASARVGYIRFENNIRAVEAERASTGNAMDGALISNQFKYLHDGMQFDSFVEQVPDDMADYFSLYGHIEGEGVMCIGDFASKEAAEEVYTLITGLDYTA